MCQIQQNYHWIFHYISQNVFVIQARNQKSDRKNIAGFPPNFVTR